MRSGNCVRSGRCVRSGGTSLLDFRSGEMSSLAEAVVTHMNECMVDGQSLVERPGFAYGFGHNEWSSRGYSGVIQGWNSADRVHWMSSRTSYLTLENDQEVAELSVPPTSSMMLDMMILGSRESDVPHAVMKAKQCMESGSLILLADFLPRVDILSGLDYYDKYFAKIAAPLTREGVKVTTVIKDFGHSDSLLLRMLQSPFAYQVAINKKGDKDANLEEAKSILKSHIDVWMAFWQSAGKAELSKAMQVNKNNRDANLHGLLVDEDKFRLAALFGPDFAPMAASLAQATVGPSYADLM